MLVDRLLAARLPPPPGDPGSPPAAPTAAAGGCGDEEGGMRGDEIWMSRVFDPVTAEVGDAMGSGGGGVGGGEGWVCELRVEKGDSGRGREGERRAHCAQGNSVLPPLGPSGRKCRNKKGP